MQHLRCLRCPRCPRCDLRLTRPTRERGTSAHQRDKRTSRQPKADRSLRLGRSVNIREDVCKVGYVRILRLGYYLSNAE